MIYSNLSIMRLDDLYISHEFDMDGTEEALNSNYLTLEAPYSIVDTEHMITYTAGQFWRRKTVDSDGNTYWNLKSVTNGWIFINLLEKYNLHTIYEIHYDYAILGSGLLDIYINEKKVQSEIGPSNWRISKPMIAIGQIHMKMMHRNMGLSDPPARCEFDHLRIFPYKLIDCEIFKYSPPKSWGGDPKDLSPLRGPKIQQSLGYRSTEIKTSLRFNAEAHTDFLSNSDKPHIFIDEKGIIYRGLIYLGDCELIGKDIYEQEITLKSPNKLGEGWK